MRDFHRGESRESKELPLSPLARSGARGRRQQRAYWSLRFEDFFPAVILLSLALEDGCDPTMVGRPSYHLDRFLCLTNSNDADLRWLCPTVSDPVNHVEIDDNHLSCRQLLKRDTFGFRLRLRPLGSFRCKHFRSPWREVWRTVARIGCAFLPLYLTAPYPLPIWARFYSF